jgi:hypothetical protein
MPRFRLARLAYFATTALALAAAVPARAVGDHVDVRIVDRATGETLTPIHHEGVWWVAGRPGAKYRVLISNRDGRRTLNVMSIDGVNVITGDTAAWDQTGYVLDAYRQTGIDGWRKNASQVAAFEFANLPDAYATLTGRPGNVGVIGVAVFDEKRVVRPLARNEASESAKTMAPPAEAPRAEPVPAPAQDASAAASDSVAPARALSLASRERLGTAHGAIEQSAITYVDFERAHPTPDEVVTIRYDRMENLIAMGIVPRPLPPVATNPPVDPFPDSRRYVPDPPARR